jgi:sortase (surface protein transpeptidase)
MLASASPVQPDPTTKPSAPTDAGYTKPVPIIPPEYPVRFSIPALNIDAKVQDVGITASGAIGSPSNFTDVGWYEVGAVPGNPGVALIDGHVDNGLALAGVFKHLSDIAVGDHVYVTNHAGKKLDFVVTSVDAYDYQHVPLNTILDSTTTGLALITCDGTWVGDRRTYDERLVVTAELQN